MMKVNIILMCILSAHSNIPTISHSHLPQHLFVVAKMMFPTKSPMVDRDALVSASHLTNKRGPWWHDRGLLKLNLLIMIPLMSEYVQGYDASLINNVQQLKSWQKGIY